MMDQELKEWTAVMMQEDPSILEYVGLQALTGIMNIRPSPPLLQEASRYWDPEHHVFRFGTAEICPTYEDYGACLRYRPRPPLTPISLVYKPPVQTHHVKDIQSFFDIEKSEAIKWIIESTIDMTAIIKKFREAKPTISKGRRNNAFLFCVVAKYLLQTGGRIGAITIIHLIPQLRDGCDIIPVILSETFAGLDRMKKKQGKNYHLMGGSPHLLQLWLAERLRMTRPLKGMNFTWAHIATHGNVPTKEWKKKLACIKDKDIRWMVGWWNMDAFIIRTGSSQHVQLMGLTHTSFYQPQRVMQQYDMPSKQDPLAPPPPSGRIIDQATYQEYKTAWIKRRIHKKMPV